MNNIYLFTVCLVMCSWVTVYGENMEENIDIEIEIANVTEDEESRRYYGLSNHDQCKNYEKTFKCLRACKNRGFEVFRMNYACKCTCHPINLSNLKHFKPEVKRTTAAELPITLYPWPTTTVATTTTYEVTGPEESTGDKADEEIGDSENDKKEGEDFGGGQQTTNVAPPDGENSGSTDASVTTTKEPVEPPGDE